MRLGLLLLLFNLVLVSRAKKRCSEVAYFEGPPKVEQVCDVDDAVPIDVLSFLQFTLS